MATRAGEPGNYTYGTPVMINRSGNFPGRKTIPGELSGVVQAPPVSSGQLWPR